MVVSSLRQQPLRAWGIPQTLGETRGYQIACGACQQISWDPWPGPIPETGLPSHGYMAAACPTCGRALVVELAPDWGQHHWHYPAWLRQTLGWDDEEWWTETRSSSA